MIQPLVTVVSWMCRAQGKPRKLGRVGAAVPGHFPKLTVSIPHLILQDRPLPQPVLAPLSFEDFPSLSSGCVTVFHGLIQHSLRRGLHFKSSLERRAHLVPYVRTQPLE